MKLILIPVLACIIVCLMNSGTMALENSMREFIVDGLRLEIHRSKEDTVVRMESVGSDRNRPSTVQVEGEKTSYVLALKDEHDGKGRELWRKEYVLPKQFSLPMGEDLEVFDVGVVRDNGEILILYGESNMVNLDVVSVDVDVENPMIRTIPLFNRSSGVGPLPRAGRLLPTSRGVAALFDLGEGLLELWIVEGNRAERLWTQWNRSE